MKVIAGTTTVSNIPMPSAFSASQSAAVQLVQATACLTPCRSASCASNLSTISPLVSWPDDSAEIAAAMSSASIWWRV